MTVNFTATGARPTYNGHYWTFYGFDGDTEITEITPVQYHIPSYIPETDLPLCDPGTQPTDAHPCSVE